MYKVMRRDADLASKIICAGSDMSFAGIVCGSNSGEVWVDSLESPAIAMVWSEHLQCFQWMGSPAGCFPATGLDDFMNDEIPAFAMEKGLDYVEYACDNAQWYTFVLNALPKYSIEESWQLVYKWPLDVNTSDPFAELPSGYQMHRIDAGFLHAIAGGSKVNNPGFLLDMLIPCWGDQNDFLRLGNGYVAMHEGDIVSVAFTDSRYLDTCTIGVETMEQHRKKGLSSTLAKALIRDLRGQHMNVWWDCMECNTASQKTAEKAGLVFDHRYKVCSYYL